MEAREQAKEEVCPAPFQAMVAETVMATVNKAKEATKSVLGTSASLSQLSSFQRLQHCLPWWQKHAPQFVMNLLLQGVETNFQG